jgi:deoxyribodipyrimidine photo-lyase
MPRWTTDQPLAIVRREMPHPVPSLRIRAVNDRPLRPDGDYVLHWMIAARRTRSNFALDRAVELARELGRPLLVFEALRCGYRWASDRLHAFVMQGMADNAADCERHGVAYRSYVEPQEGAGRGLLAALATRACAVVTDDWPCGFVPHMVEAAGRALPVRLEAVDGNGLLPLAAGEKAFGRAYDFRRHLQKHLPGHLAATPTKNPLARLRGMPHATPPEAVTQRWLAKSGSLDALHRLPIDHRVAPSPVLHGGARAGHVTLARFVDERLARYAEERSHPDADAQSDLSPWLHFGHVGVHEVLEAVTAPEDWSPSRIASTTSGAKDGWWGASTNVEAFLDELVTWRELGFNVSHHRPDDYDRYESLPGWARASLELHGADPRPRRHTLAELADAATADPVWNAAQTQLREEGRLHNYLRMLWGKRVLEWTGSAREALEVLVELNNRYAVDGRDPNSYSGIFWCLGRFDRPWAPERPIFGVIRYMSSANTLRKLRMKGYLARYTRAPRQATLPGMT